MWWTPLILRNSYPNGVPQSVPTIPAVPAAVRDDFKNSHRMILTSELFVAILQLWTLLFPKIWIRKKEFSLA